MDQQTVQAFLNTSRSYLLNKGKIMDTHSQVHQPSGLLYPLMVIAGVSVTVFSLLGTAAITGHLPAAQAAAFAPAAKQPLSTADKPNQVAAATKNAGRYACNACGTVAAVHATEIKGQGSGLGAVAGGVTGAILGTQIGNGNGRTAATLLGAAGGAYLGNEIEKNTKAVTRYTVTVRMSDGSVRTFQRSAPEFAVGQKVRVEGGTLRPLTLS